MTSQVNSNVVQSCEIVWCNPLFTKYGAPSPPPTIPLPPPPPLPLLPPKCFLRNKEVQQAGAKLERFRVSGAEGGIPVPKVEVVRAASDPTFKGGDPTREERSVEGHVGPVAGSLEAGSGNWWDELHRIEKAERSERVESARKGQEYVREQLAVVERAAAVAEEEIALALELAKGENSVEAIVEGTPSATKPAYFLGMAKRSFWIMMVTMALFLVVVGSVATVLHVKNNGPHGINWVNMDDGSNLSHTVNTITTNKSTKITAHITTALTTTAFTTTTTSSAIKVSGASRTTTFVTITSLRKSTTILALVIPTPTPYTNSTDIAAGRHRGRRAV